MMKKLYSAPDIFFEDFSLSTNIAAGCEVKPVNNAAVCAVQYWRTFIFVNDINACEKKIHDGALDDNHVDSKNNGLCYHVPNSVFNVFNS